MLLALLILSACELIEEKPNVIEKECLCPGGRYYVEINPNEWPTYPPPLMKKCHVLTYNILTDMFNKSSKSSGFEILPEMKCGSSVVLRYLNDNSPMDGTSLYLRGFCTNNNGPKMNIDYYERNVLDDQITSCGLSINGNNVRHMETG